MVPKMFGGPGRQERQIVGLRVGSSRTPGMARRAGSRSGQHDVWEEARNDNNYVKSELLVLNNNMAGNMPRSRSMQRDAIKVKFQSVFLAN